MEDAGTYQPPPPDPNAPPTLAAGSAPPEDTSRWPKVIGIFSLIYGFGGMFCGLMGAAWAIFGAAMMAKLMDAQFTIPTVVKATTIGLTVFNLMLGVVLVVGAVSLLRRKRSGVRLHVRWALLRMILILVGVVVAIFTAPMQIDMQKAMEEAGNRKLVESGRPPKPLSTDAQVYHKMIISTAIFSGVLSIYPLFIGFYLSRRKIREQISHWPNK